MMFDTPNRSPASCNAAVALSSTREPACVRSFSRSICLDGTLDLNDKPTIELTIDADSLETKNGQRDKHLRSADFFGVEQHPQVRFVSDTVTLAGEKLIVHGQLHAGGANVPLEFDASIRP